MYDDEIKIWINFYPQTGGSNEIPVVTEDGIVLSKDRDNEITNYYMGIDRGDNFSIRMMCGYEIPKFGNWKKELPFLVSYFQGIKKEDFLRLCLWWHHIDFYLKKFHEKRNMTEQIDYLLDRYEGWYLLTFDESYVDLFAVPKYREMAEEKLIYHVHRYDSPEIWMFMKELTAENMDQNFAWLFGLRLANKELQSLLKKISEDYSLTQPWRYLDVDKPAS